MHENVLPHSVNAYRHGIIHQIIAISDVFKDFVYYKQKFDEFISLIVSFSLLLGV